MIEVILKKIGRKIRYLYNKLKTFINYTLKYWRWRYRIKYGRSIDISDNMHKATVIINSYNRVKNIQHMVQAALKCDFVEKVIISNNNPQVQIENWVNVSDDRLLLIQHKFRKRCRYRWIIAAKTPRRYYIAIDDDLFVSPEQLKKLFESLIDDPSVPHGMFGSVYISNDPNNEEMSSAYSYFNSKNVTVDVLHQIYAVTDEHVSNYFDLLAKIRGNNREVSKFLRRIGDDIVMSHAGSERPKTHDFGFVLECASHNRAGLATFQDLEFSQKRIRIFREVRRTVLQYRWTNKKELS
ncbi:MAG: glycosyltransferase [Thiocapsa sp.]|uniref:glycosyltransferase n=1 Tax=Thiocapsa sp. TaxID=2024551 RepID=UPI001BCD9337|nr:glycosyltransferase [Thiocapsa sp.]QVL50285.1 MAG: glycosyltransferase [Thiocapsa sp.]